MTQTEFSYDIDQGNNLVAQHAEGALDLNTLESITLRLTEDEKYQPGMNCLTDLRETNPRDDAPGAGESGSGLPKPEFHKHAILARTRRQVGLARNYEARCQASKVPYEIVVFRDEADALDWLKD